MDDLISRQAAIDIERNATVDTNPTHFEAHQKFIQFMDDAEISSFGRWQWANGFNMALTAVGIDLKKLPSIQPDAVPVVHGKWKKEGRWSRGRMYRCDQCGNYLDFYGVNAGRGDANYCPNCGARMDAERKEE